MTHKVTLDWADAALGEQRHGGLTEFDRTLVREMNRTGMLVDIAHTSSATMHQYLHTDKAWREAFVRREKLLDRAL